MDVVYRLFVSHSSPTPEAKTRLRQIVDGIRAADRNGEQIEVLYDQEQIAGGDEWRRRIVFMLHVCDGGILLLDRHARESVWVRAEAMFLAFRRIWDGSFAVIPVALLDGGADTASPPAVTPGDLSFFAGDAQWAVAALPEAQFVSGRTPDDIVEGVVTALRAVGSPATAGSPAEALADQLATRMPNAENRLRELAARITRGRGYLRADDRRLAALAIVCDMLEHLKLTRIRGLLDTFGSSLDGRETLRILHELAPLALESRSGAILRLARSGGNYQHVTLCCTNPEWLVPLYVRRAYLAVRRPTIFAIANETGTFEEIQGRLRSGMRDQIRAGIRPLSDGAVDRHLEAGPSGREDRTSDVYVYVPGLLDADVIATIGRRYPRVRLILYFPPGDEPAVLPAGLERIDPPLSAEEEDEIVVDYELATESLLSQEEWCR